jgi:DNA modification methylase
MPESVRDRCTKSHEYIFLLSKSPKYYFDHVAIKEKAKNPKGSGNKRPGFVSNQRDGENANLVGSLHKIGPRETRNKRSVWTVTTKSFKGAHFATFPIDLIEPCILAGCPEGGTVLDPFSGSGTVAVAAKKHNRNSIGIELNPEYIEIAERRIAHGR